MNYDLTLPDPKRVRTVEGTTVKPAMLYVFDRQGRMVTQMFADERRTFQLALLAEEAYQLRAVWTGEGPETVRSAVPIEIAPGNGTMHFSIVLTQPGNSYLEKVKK